MEALGEVKVDLSKTFPCSLASQRVGVLQAPMDACYGPGFKEVSLDPP